MNIDRLPYFGVNTDSPWEKPRAEAYRKENGYHLQKFDDVVEATKICTSLAIGFGLSSVFVMAVSNLIPNDTLSTVVKYPSVALGLTSAFFAVGASYNISRIKRGEYLYGLTKRTPSP